VRPLVEASRIYRGGSWHGGYPEGLRCVDRILDAPSRLRTGLGLRPVLDVPKEKPHGHQG